METVDFSETIAASDLKGRRSRHLIEFRKVCEGQGHFFTIYFPGFVCFVLYWATSKHPKKILRLLNAHLSLVSFKGNALISY